MADSLNVSVPRSRSRQAEQMRYLDGRASATDLIKLGGISMYCNYIILLWI